MNHAPFIHRCLELAEHGHGRVGINPLVGSVLVRDGKIIAEAFHEGFGLHHAERVLLERLKEDVQPDDILYVNLEPCCHRGKTPPCTDIIIEKGIKSVVYGMKDPNPEVAGKGIEAFRNAGVEVIGPVLPELCLRLNRGFVSLKTKGRPWITIKRAQTRSGAIADPDGSTLKITSQEQDEWSHLNLRMKHDAILVGVGTILSDNPELTVRFGSTDYQPLRIVLDPNFTVPLNARVRGEGTLLIVGDVKSGEVVKLRSEGMQVEEVPLKNGRFDFEALWKVLTTPHESFNARPDEHPFGQGITSILVEGGAETWKSFKEAGMVDEEVVLVG